MAITTQNIITALRHLNVRGSAHLEYISADRVRVLLNGEYFGLWDSEKATFID